MAERLEAPVVPIEADRHRCRTRGIRVVTLIAVVVLVSGIAAVREARRPTRQEMSATAPQLGGHEPSNAAPGGSLQVRIVLDALVVHGGSSIQAEAVFVNTTSQAVPIFACQDDWLAVGLGNPAISFDPPLPLALCPHPALALAPGVSRFPVTVRAAYSACTYPNLGYSASAERPFCVGPATPPSQLPPLPSGDYETSAVIQGLPPGTMPPASVRVAVLP